MPPLKPQCGHAERKTAGPSGFWISTALGFGLSDQSPLEPRFASAVESFFVSNKRERLAKATGRFKAYLEYIESDHWKCLRRQALAIRQSCLLCYRVSNLRVHHIRYRNLIDCTTDDLRVLCERCHDMLHELERKKIVDVFGLDDEAKFNRLAAAVKRHVKGNRKPTKPRRVKFFVEIFLPAFLDQGTRQRIDLRRFDRKFHRLAKRCKQFRAHNKWNRP